MELGPLVALRLPLRIPRLAGAELAEVLRRLGDGVLEELERHAAERRACQPSVIIHQPHHHTPTSFLSISTLDIEIEVRDERGCSALQVHTSKRDIKKDPKPSARQAFPHRRPRHEAPLPFPATPRRMRRPRTLHSRADDVPRPSPLPGLTSRAVERKTPAGESGPRAGVQGTQSDWAPGGGIWNRDRNLQRVPRLGELRGRHC